MLQIVCMTQQTFQWDKILVFGIWQLMCSVHVQPLQRSAAIWTSSVWKRPFFGSDKAVVNCKPGANHPKTKIKTRGFWPSVIVFHLKFRMACSLHYLLFSLFMISWSAPASTSVPPSWFHYSQIFWSPDLVASHLLICRSAASPPPAASQVQQGVAAMDATTWSRWAYYEEDKNISKNAKYFWLQIISFLVSH